MTTLIGADGSLLRTQPPGRTTASEFGATGAGSFLGASSRPLWTSGDQSDAYGYHSSSGSLVPFDVVYRTQAVVAAVVNKLGRQIATTPLKVYRTDKDGNHQRIRADSDDAGASLVRLLERPSPRHGAVHLKQWMSLPSLIYGNSLLAKFYADGPQLPPTELIPMDWRFVTAYAERGGPVELWQTSEIGSPRYVDANATLHFAWGNPSGPIGISPLEQLAVALRLEDAAQRWQTASFRNSARPSSVVIPPAGTQLTADTVREMRASLDAMHKGVDSAFKVGILAPGSEWRQMGFNMQEAELMSSRKFNRDEVCMVYDVKPGQIGDLSTPGAGYGSVVEVNRDLYRTTLRPWFTMMEETIEAQLIRPERAWDGLQVEFDMAEFLKGEPEAVAAQIATEVKSGTMTQNEGRKLQNRPRSDNPLADQLWIEANNMRPTGAPVDTPQASQDYELPPILSGRSAQVIPGDPAEEKPTEASTGSTAPPASPPVPPRP